MTMGREPNRMTDGRIITSGGQVSASRDEDPDPYNPDGYPDYKTPGDSIVNAINRAWEWFSSRRR